MRDAPGYMHYYQFNIGDYKSHTEHLSEMEDLAYRRLLDWYYLHETSIPLDIAETARQIRMRSHCDCIATVLNEFFQRTDSGWVHQRADKEIANAVEKSAKAAESARKRWGKDANAMRTHSEGNATHNTRHITQDTDIKEANASLSSDHDDLGAKVLELKKTELPCPHQKLIELYAKHLPNLAKPRSWDGQRQTAMRQRWHMCSKKSAFSDGYTDEAGGLAFWDSFFEYLARDTQLPNGYESNGRHWVPDLPWILNSTNFQKILDGKYDLQKNRARR